MINYWSYNEINKTVNEDDRLMINMMNVDRNDDWTGNRGDENQCFVGLVPINQVQYLR